MIMRFSNANTNPNTEAGGSGNTKKMCHAPIGAWRAWKNIVEK